MSFESYVGTLEVIAEKQVLRHRDGYMVQETPEKIYWMPAEEFEGSFLHVEKLRHYPDHVKPLVIEAAQIRHRLAELHDKIKSAEEGKRLVRHPSESELALLKEAYTPLRAYLKKLDALIEQTRHRTVRVENFELKSQEVNLFSLGEVFKDGVDDMTDTVAEIRVTNLKTSEGYPIKSKFELNESLQGSRHSNYTLYFGEAICSIALDKERGSMKLSATHEHGVTADIEIVLVNPNASM